MSEEAQKETPDYKSPSLQPDEVSTQQILAQEDKTTLDTSDTVTEIVQSSDPSLSDSDQDATDSFEESDDSLTFSNGVIEKIVALAMRDVPGVLGMKGGWFNKVQETFGTRDPRKGVTVEATSSSAVRVNISVMIEYGVYAPQVFEDVKKAVVKQINKMTGLEIAGINLRIEDVLTPEEYAAHQKREKLLREQAEEDLDKANVARDQA